MSGLKVAKAWYEISRSRTANHTEDVIFRPQNSPTTEKRTAKYMQNSGISYPDYLSVCLYEPADFF
jgi:hypothetical protein